MAAYFVIQTEPVKTEHIAWTTRQYYDSGKRMIALVEIVENYYRHPDAPEHSIVPVIEAFTKAAFQEIEHDAAPLMLLLHAEQNIDIVLKTLERKEAFKAFKKTQTITPVTKV